MIGENTHDVDVPGTGGNWLREVEADFVGIIDQMQTLAHRQGVDALFTMSERELGEAALKGVSDPD